MVADLQISATSVVTQAGIRRAAMHRYLGRWDATRARASSNDPDRSDAIRRRALALKEEVEGSNQLDIVTLRTQLHQYSRMSKGSIRSTAGRIRDRLLRDLQAYREALRIKNQKLPPELFSSLRKLAGNEEQTGIIEDALTLLDRNPAVLGCVTERTRATGNSLTVLKTLLFYANVDARSEWVGRCMEQLRLVYPAEFPKRLAPVLGPTALHLGGRCLAIPNAGYVWGGNLIDGWFMRGIDCGAFVCFSAASGRLYTEDFERLSHADGLNQDHARLGTACREYKFLGRRLSPEMLRPGDIAVWRWAAKECGRRAGHCAVVVRRCKEHINCFVAVQANREDDKSVEGMFISHHETLSAGRDLYFFRRTGYQGGGSPFI